MVARKKRPSSWNTVRPCNYMAALTRRLWSGLSSHSLSTWLSQLQTDELLAHVDDILLRARENPEQLTAYDAVFVYRRYASLLCKVEPSSLAKIVVPCFDLFIELMGILKAHDLRRMRQVKQALPQTFSQFLPYTDISLPLFLQGTTF